jgi:hypothetical protein
VRGTHADGDSSPIDEPFVEFERGSLITLLSDLRCLIEDMMQKQALFVSSIHSIQEKQKQTNVLVELVFPTQLLGHTRNKALR